MILSKGLFKSGYNFVPPYWDHSKFRPLTNTTQVFGTGIFYFDRHDSHMRNIEFDNFIEDAHWKIVYNKRAKILIDFSDEYFNLNDLRKIFDTLIKRKIDGDNVYFLTMDKNWTGFVNRYAAKRGLGIRVQDFPGLMFKTIKQYPKNILPLEYNTKFSMLSRNYRTWRLDFALRLLGPGILSNPKSIRYSFHNIEPYENITFTTAEILKDAEALGYNNDTVNNWILNIPHDLPDSDLNKFHTITYRVIESSDIHLLIESHYDPYIRPSVKENEAAGFTPSEWSPAFCTEKFYKAIIAKKPFIAITTPHFMKEVEQYLGYKTFSPFIDQSYDSIEDDNLRMKALANAVKDLNSLGKSEFKSVVDNLQSITEHNYNNMMSEYAKPRLTGKFKFLRNYIDKSYLPAHIFND